MADNKTKVEDGVIRRIDAEKQVVQEAAQNFIEAKKKQDPAWETSIEGQRFKASLGYDKNPAKPSFFTTVAGVRNFFVGDPDKSIYARATPSEFSDFTPDFRLTKEEKAVRVAQKKLLAAQRTLQGTMDAEFGTHTLQEANEDAVLVGINPLRIIGAIATKAWHGATDTAPKADFSLVDHGVDKDAYTDATKIGTDKKMEEAMARDFKQNKDIDNAILYNPKARDAMKKYKEEQKEKQKKGDNISDLEINLKARNVGRKALREQVSEKGGASARLAFNNALKMNANKGMKQGDIALVAAATRLPIASPNANQAVDRAIANNPKARAAAEKAMIEAMKTQEPDQETILSAGRKAGRDVIERQLDKIPNKATSLVYKAASTAYDSAEKKSKGSGSDAGFVAGAKALKGNFGFSLGPLGNSNAKADQLFTRAELERLKPKATKPKTPPSPTSSSNIKPGKQ